MTTRRKRIAPPLARFQPLVQVSFAGFCNTAHGGPAQGDGETIRPAPRDWSLVRNNSLPGRGDYPAFAAKLAN